jgi:hypothetical protein
MRLRVPAGLLCLDLVAVLGYIGIVHHSIPPIPESGTWPVGILFFADFGSDEGLGPKSRDRVEYASELYRSGRVEALLAVGGRRRDPDRFGSRRMADALETLGLQPGALLVEQESFDTRTNWREADAILRDRVLRDVLLISSALHLYRIKAIAPPGYRMTCAPTRPVGEALLRRPIETWFVVHREWIAWLAMWILPDDAHRTLIRRWRDLLQ